MSENPLSCQQVRDRFSDFLAGDLANAERRLIETHLSGCTSCQQILEDLKRTIQLLSQLPKPKPHREN